MHWIIEVLVLRRPKLMPEDPEDDEHPQEPYEKGENTVFLFLGEPENGVPGRHLVGLPGFDDLGFPLLVFTHAIHPVFRGLFSGRCAG
jgi:hypothetical protein